MYPGNGRTCPAGICCDKNAFLTSSNCCIFKFYFLSKLIKKVSILLMKKHRLNGVIRQVLTLQL